MCISPRLVVGLCAFCVFCLGLGPTSVAFAWTVRFAPLEPMTRDANAFAPSTELPVAPQFFRIAIAPQQITIGAEEPYIRAIEFAPPIRFKSISPAPEPPVASTRRVRPRHQLRGPEAFLLRRTQNVAGKPLP